MGGAASSSDGTLGVSVATAHALVPVRFGVDGPQDSNGTLLLQVQMPIPSASVPPPRAGASVVLVTILVAGAVLLVAGLLVVWRQRQQGKFGHRKTALASPLISQENGRNGRGLVVL